MTKDPVAKRWPRDEQIPDDIYRHRRMERHAAALGFRISPIRVWYVPGQLQAVAQGHRDGMYAEIRVDHGASDPEADAVVRLDRALGCHDSTARP